VQGAHPPSCTWESEALPLLAHGPPNGAGGSLLAMSLHEERTGCPAVHHFGGGGLSIQQRARSKDKTARKSLQRQPQPMASATRDLLRRSWILPSQTWATAWSPTVGCEQAFLHVDGSGAQGSSWVGFGELACLERARGMRGQWTPGPTEDCGGSVSSWTQAAAEHGQKSEASSTHEPLLWSAELGQLGAYSKERAAVTAPRVRVVELWGGLGTKRGGGVCHQFHRVRKYPGGGGFGMTPWCDDLVCSWRRLLADRHSLPFPWTLSLHRRWCPSASHHPLTFLFLPALTLKRRGGGNPVRKALVHFGIDSA